MKLNPDTLKVFFIIILLLSIFSAPSVFAQAKDGSASPPVDGRASAPDKTPQNIPRISNPLYANSFEDLLFKIVDIAVFIGVIIAVLMFIFIGFKFVMAQGDPGALKEARTWFLYAVIGTAVLISSKVIVEVIKNTLTSAGVVNEELFKKPK